LKRSLTLVALVAALAAAPPAHAQTFGQFTGAEVIPVNGRMFGAYVVASSNVSSLLAHLRLSFYPGVDFGFQGGLARQNYSSGDRTTVRLGTDVRISVMRPSPERPMSIGAGGFLTVETGDNWNVLTLGPSVVASWAVTTGQYTSIKPYTSVGLAFSNVDVGPLSDTDFSVPWRVGSEFGIAPGVRIVGELQFQLGDKFNDDFGFSAGANFPF